MKGRGFKRKLIRATLVASFLLPCAPLSAIDPERAREAFHSAVLKDQNQGEGVPAFAHVKALFEGLDEAETLVFLEAGVGWWTGYCQKTANLSGAPDPALQEVVFLLGLYAWLLDSPSLPKEARVTLSAAVQAESGEDVFLPLNLLFRLDALYPKEETGPESTRRLRPLLQTVALRGEGQIAAVAVSKLANRLELRERVGLIYGLLQPGKEGAYSDGARVGALEVLERGRKMPDEREAWLGLARELLKDQGLERGSLVASALESVLVRSASGPDCSLRLRQNP